MKPPLQRFRGDGMTKTLDFAYETPLAEAAVTAAAQLGVDKYLSGEAKKSKAVQYVTDGLNSLGFTNADEVTVKNAVEKAFSDLQDELYKTYPQATEV